MKRVVVPELLDNDEFSPREVADSLADIQMFNRRFGGIRTMTTLLSTVATQRKLKSLSWLDVAGAYGDLASCTSKVMARKGIEVKPVLLDRVVTHLNNRITSVCADALSLPFRDNSFDVVGSCLFLHHLDPEQIVAFAAEGLRVARHAVLINDLVRDPLLLALAYAGLPVYRSRISWHDGPASVRRAYTVNELKSILQESTAFKTEIEKFYPFRVGGVMWKRPSAFIEGELDN
jgi:ubiquinone/menaquinone biosynthesis C-methylase UbiE